MDSGTDVREAARRRLARASASVRPAIWDLDLLTGVFIAPSALSELLGREPHQPLDFGGLVEATHPADRAWSDELTRTPHPASLAPAAKSFCFRIIRGDAVRWVLMKVEIEHATTKAGIAPVSYTGMIEDITEAYETAAALTASEERLKLAIEAGRMAVWEVDLESGALAQSAELNLLLGFPSDARITLADVRGLYAAGEMERIARDGISWELIKTRAAHGKSPALKSRSSAPEPDRTQIQAEVAIATPQGVRKHLLLRAQHAVSLHGQGERVTGLLIDITERKRSEERLAVVARELQHRVKNSLAVVQTLAVQSFRGAADSDKAGQAFLGRLRALAAASDLILEEGGDAAVLGNIVEAVIRPYRMGEHDPFEIGGDAVELAGSTATALGMALHELCTNAVKYGALSTPAGRVQVTWRTETNSLVIDWVEENGPTVFPPVKRGFGSRLLQTVLAGEPNGQVETNFEPFGLRCRLSLALR